jgi:hypothetical protein
MSEKKPSPSLNESEVSAGLISQLTFDAGLNFAQSSEISDECAKTPKPHIECHAKSDVSQRILTRT